MSRTKSEAESATTPVTDSAFRQLMGVLWEQHTMYGELLEQEGPEKAAIAERELGRLGEIVARKEEIISRLDSLEKAREQATASLAGSLEICGSSLQLWELAEHLDPERASQLRGLRGAVSRRIIEVAEYNRRNAELLSASLKLIDTSINFLIGLQASQISYAADGRGPALGRAKLNSRLNVRA